MLSLSLIVFWETYQSKYYKVMFLLEQVVDVHYHKLNYAEVEPFFGSKHLKEDIYCGVSLIFFYDTMLIVFLNIYNYMEHLLVRCHTKLIGGIVTLEQTLLMSMIIFFK